MIACYYYHIIIIIINITFYHITKEWILNAMIGVDWMILYMYV